MRHFAADRRLRPSRHSGRTMLAAALCTTVLLVSCGGDETSGTTSVAVDLGVGSLPAGDTSPTVPAGPTQTTTADSSPSLVTAGPVQVDVVVGRDSGPDRVEQIAVGSDVTVNITNPDAADEFHVHGFDLERAVDAGVMATFNFTADTAGTFEIESHETGEVLVVLVVE